MLVLSRKHNERISVIVDGKKIGEICVVKFKPGADGRLACGGVRLGFEFPQNVKILRTELEQTIAEASGHVEGK